MTPDIELVIDELSLHGFDRRDRDRIVEAIQDELTSLLSGSANNSPFSTSGHVDRIDAGTMRVPQGASPAVVGSQVAQAVYRGIGR
jgi:hypothetical protein